MSKTTNKNLITQTQFALELGVTQPYIAKLVRLHKIKLEKGKVNRRKAISAMKDNLDPARESVFNRAPTSKQETEDANPDSLSARLRHSIVMDRHYTAGLKKLAYEEKTGRLVDREKYDDIVLRGLSARDIIVKKYILSIPDRLARMWPNKKTANKLKVMARKEIRIALEELTQVDISEIEKEMK